MYQFLHLTMLHRYLITRYSSTGSEHVNWTSRRLVVSISCTATIRHFCLNGVEMREDKGRTLRARMSAGIFVTVQYAKGIFCICMPMLKVLAERVRWQFRPTRRSGAYSLGRWKGEISLPFCDTSCSSDLFKSGMMTLLLCVRVGDSRFLSYWSKLGFRAKKVVKL